MNAERFNKTVGTVIKGIQNTLMKKAEEYARGGDRLSNFRQAAFRRGCTPEEALRGMATKHEVAIDDFINDLANGKLMRYDQWLEKIGDSINYNILLLGLIQERYLLDAEGNSEATDKPGD